MVDPSLEATQWASHNGPFGFVVRNHCWIAGGRRTPMVEPSLQGLLRSPLRGGATSRREQALLANILENIMSILSRSRWGLQGRVPPWWSLPCSRWGLQGRLRGKGGVWGGVPPRWIPPCRQPPAKQLHTLRSGQLKKQSQIYLNYRF
jgi:hypothetical protein